MQGRYLQIDFEHISIGSMLAPQANGDPASESIKLKFFDDLQAHMHKISRKRRDFIFCGNWGMAHKAVDVQNPEQNQNTPGFTAFDQQWLNQLFSELEYVDAFRQVNKDKDEFSYWPSGKMGEGNGWRTDFQVISASLKNRTEHAVVYKNQVFSSHLPVIIDYDLEVVELD
jgi:exodeoxyribonuclease-3